MLMDLMDEEIDGEPVRFDVFALRWKAASWGRRSSRAPGIDYSSIRAADGSMAVWHCAALWRPGAVSCPPAVSEAECNPVEVCKALPAAPPANNCKKKKKI